ncbi:hypothetical protein BJX62DRAFT_245676 [Aspergillus germanicus]
MADTYAELQYMQQVAQERYPALSAVDALVALHRGFALLLRPIAKVTPDLMKLYEAAGILKAIFPQIEEGYKSLFGTARTVSSNSTGEGDAISAQLTAQILERFKSGSLGSLNPVSDGVGAATAIPTAGAGLAAGNVPGAKNNAAAGAQNACGSGASFLQGLKYNQLQALNAIADHLEDGNAITVSGSAGPYGFAQHVYRFIKGKILDIDEAERDKHRFFVFHPDTIWYPAFGELVRKNPLPPQFVDKGQRLENMCLFMREVRTKLNEGDPEHGKDVTFHLLMPSCDRGFDECRGYRDGEDEPSTSPDELLDGVANVLDPKGWNKFAGIARDVARSGLLGVVGIRFQYNVYNLLREEAPRVLGSDTRLDLEPRTASREEYFETLARSMKAMTKHHQKSFTPGFNFDWQNTL